MKISMNIKAMLLALLCLFAFSIPVLAVDVNSTDATPTEPTTTIDESVTEPVLTSDSTEIVEPLTSNDETESLPAPDALATEDEDASLSTESVASFWVSDGNNTIQQYVAGTRRYLFLPSDVDLSNLVIHFNGGVASVVRGGVNITSSCLDNSAKTITLNFNNASNTNIDNDTSGNSTFKVTDTSGNTVKVVVMRSNLPSLCINLNGYSLNDIHADKDLKAENQTVSIVDPNHSNDASYNFTDSTVELKGRGNTTWAADKKPYQIKYSKKQSVLGMPAAKKWVLLANAYDASFIRNSFSFDMAEILSPNNFQVSGKHVDLWISGQYLGNYYLCEKVENGSNRINLENDLGVVIECDNFYYKDEDIYGKSSGGNWYTVKESVADDYGKGPNTQAGFNDFMKSMNAFESALKSGANYTTLSKYVDMDSFAKWYLLDEFAGDPDGITSSCYFYKDGPNDVIHMGPIWDMDSAYGTYIPEDWSNASNLKIANGTTLAGYGYNWFYPLLKKSEFKTLVSKKWSYARDAVTNNVNTISSSPLADSAAMNFKRWDVLGANLHANQGNYKNFSTTYSGNVSEVKSWCQTRLNAFNSAYYRANQYTLGDTNNDTHINSVDALLDLQHSVQIITLDNEAKIRGDVDLNKIINSTDALKILQYSVGIINKF